MKTALIAAAAAMLAAGPALAETPAKVAVEIWLVGDDGLTQRFQQTLETAFKASPGFTVGSEGQGEVKVTINQAKPAISPGAFLYSVLVEPKGAAATTVSGNCYEDAMADCADYILDKTYGTALKARPAASAKP